MAQPDKPIEVFISYSQKDSVLLEQLKSQLSNLEREQQIKVWYDREMVAGDEWNDEINRRLNSAGIIFLLVSLNFLASKFCFDIELPRIISREDAGETIVIPILLTACEWETTPFSRFQLLPGNRVPVTSWPNTDEAFRDVVKGIRKAVEKLRAKSETISDQPAAKTISRSKLRPLLPYLCDRSDQETELGIGLRQHQLAKNTRPIVCLVHGDEREAHDEFLKRINHSLLPTLLRTNGS
ncbi:MAG: TIR domain-containing protein, partial [Acidobacteriota bacterium]